MHIFVLKLKDHWASWLICCLLSNFQSSVLTEIVGPFDKGGTYLIDKSIKLKRNILSNLNFF